MRDLFDYKHLVESLNYEEEIKNLIELGESEPQKELIFRIAKAVTRSVVNGLLLPRVYRVGRSNPSGTPSGVMGGGRLLSVFELKSETNARVKGKPYNTTQPMVAPEVA